jgi:hypothetical protein
MQVGLAAALVCALGVNKISAKELDFAPEPIAERPMSSDIVLAQSFDDCGCGDSEDYDDSEEYYGDREDYEDDEDYGEDFGANFEEGFEEGMEDGFAEAFEEGFNEGFAENDDEGYGEDYGADDGGYYAGNQGLTADERINKVTDGELRVMERAMDVRLQGSYNYFGPADGGNYFTPGQ